MNMAFTVKYIFPQRPLDNSDVSAEFIITNSDFLKTMKEVMILYQISGFTMLLLFCTWSCGLCFMHIHIILESSSVIFFPGL